MEVPTLPKQRYIEKQYNDWIEKKMIDAFLETDEDAEELTEAYKLLYNLAESPHLRGIHEAILPYPSGAPIWWEKSSFRIPRGTVHN